MRSASERYRGILSAVGRWTHEHSRSESKAGTQRRFLITSLHPFPGYISSRATGYMRTPLQPHWPTQSLYVLKISALFCISLSFISLILTPQPPFLPTLLHLDASQLSYHGLVELGARVPENGLCVLFRNNHFSVLHKHNNMLLMLLTDQGFLETGAVWVSFHRVAGWHRKRYCGKSLNADSQ